MRSANTMARSNNRLLDALMAEKRKGGALSGVVGRLGDLGGIDREYVEGILTISARFYDHSSYI